MRLSLLLILVLLLSGQMTVAATTGAGQVKIYQARDKVMPAVVHIQPIIKNYRTGELEKQAVVGSGVIFHPDGYVVTNYHVAGRAERIICTLEDKEVVPAEFIGGDPPTDIAVIKLNLEEYEGRISVAEFGDSDSIQVGQYVLAMGSPLSLSRSVSAGVISTCDRYFSSDVRLPSGELTGNYNLWIQTDAAINPGNSGGPLVNMAGRVIGINSRATIFANNLGFAIPVNVVKAVTGAILRDEKVTRSWIGLHCQALQELEGHFRAERNAGVLISSIDPGSPAEEVFLKAGDIILELDGQPVSARFEEELPVFYAAIADHEPGSEIVLKVLSGEQVYQVSVRTRRLGDLQGKDFECSNWGFTVKAITRQMRVDNQLKDTAGVFVIGVKRASSAAEGGLHPLDVIVSINNQTITGLPDFISIYNELGMIADKGVLLTVRRGSATRFVVVKTDNRERGR